MKEALIQIICSGIGTLGFALFLHVRPRHLPVVTFGGFVSWVCYLLVWQGTASFFISSLVASAVICVWSELMARMWKAPANIFLIPGIISLLPGAAMYYAMSGVINTDMALFVRKGEEAAFVAVGITVGIVVGSEIVRLVLGMPLWKHQKPEKKN